MDATAFYHGALALSRIYAEVLGQSEPSYGSFDGSRVERTNFGYPGAQCRLQSIVAGWNRGPRPSC